MLSNSLELYEKNQTESNKGNMEKPINKINYDLGDVEVFYCTMESTYAHTYLN